MTVRVAVDAKTCKPETLLVGMEAGAATTESGPAVPQHVTQCNSAIPLLGLCPREMKTSPHTNLYTNVRGSTRAKR